MFGLFKKPSREEKLQKEYKKMLEEAHRLSTVDRRKSDEATFKANELLKEIEKLRSNS